MKKSIELSQENTLKLQKAFDLEVEKSKKLQDDVRVGGIIQPSNLCFYE